MIVLTDAAFTAMLVAPSRLFKSFASTFVSVIVTFSAFSGLSAKLVAKSAAFPAATVAVTFPFVARIAAIEAISAVEVAGRVPEIVTFA